MKVFEIYFDSFRYSYNGTWSSIEKAISDLPTNPRFLRMIDCNRPHFQDPDKDIYCEPDWEYNKAIPVVLTFNESHNTLEMSRPGYKFKRFKKVTIPEIKEEGEIYSPSRTYNDEIEPYFMENQVVKVGDVTAINVDCMSDYY